MRNRIDRSMNAIVDEIFELLLIILMFHSIVDHHIREYSNHYMLQRTIFPRKKMNTLNVERLIREHIITTIIIIITLMKIDRPMTSFK